MAGVREEGLSVWVELGVVGVGGALVWGLPSLRTYLASRATPTGTTTTPTTGLFYRLTSGQPTTGTTPTGPTTTTTTTGPGGLYHRMWVWLGEVERRRQRGSTVRVIASLLPNALFSPPTRLVTPKGSLHPHRPHQQSQIEAFNFSTVSTEGTWAGGGDTESLEESVVENDDKGFDVAEGKVVPSEMWSHVKPELTPTKNQGINESDLRTMKKEDLEDDANYHSSSSTLTFRSNVSTATAETTRQKVNDNAKLKPRPKIKPLKKVGNDTQMDKQIRELQQMISKISSDLVDKVAKCNELLLRELPPPPPPPHESEESEYFSGSESPPTSPEEWTLAFTSTPEERPSLGTEANSFASSSTSSIKTDSDYIAEENRTSPERMSPEEQSWLCAGAECITSTSTSLQGRESLEKRTDGLAMAKEPRPGPSRQMTLNRESDGRHSLKRVLAERFKKFSMSSDEEDDGWSDSGSFFSVDEEHPRPQLHPLPMISETMPAMAQLNNDGYLVSEVRPRGKASIRHSAEFEFPKN